jgi:predicted ATPase/class 3 adenylate cyclase
MPAPVDNQPRGGERRQLSVMFCDLVGSTALSGRVDPEELQEIIANYHAACVKVIERFNGFVAKYLGDGLLVYFGYPIAHEDDARGAVRAALGIVEELHNRGASERDTDGSVPLQVRIGIHTGLVVVGEIGVGERREADAITGETPNLAARIQQAAEPNTVSISSATHALVHGFFLCENLGNQELKGIAEPVQIYRVVGESSAQSRLDAAGDIALTPLVGREEELRLLLRHWQEAQKGEGQVVLLSGEPGIGKSRLLRELREEVVKAGGIRIEFQCSPYHQNSSLYPCIHHLHRALALSREDSPEASLHKLETRLSEYRFPGGDTAALLASLLSLPSPGAAKSLNLSSQKQKEKTQEALLAWILEDAERQPIYCAWEDLHWADPSTLEFLTLFLRQVPSSRTLAVLTFRPEFRPPRSSDFSQITLRRLRHGESTRIVEGVTDGRSLPPEVLRQIVNKTDGVPLFVEELTRMVIGSGLLRETDSQYELTGPLPPLAIPNTLQDSLAARLDRLGGAREIAQIAATIGREFSYEVLSALEAFDEPRLQRELLELVNAELVYQRGFPPNATYVFKHALVRDAAYHSLLKSRRQQLHQRIGRMLETQFPETVATQPELVAYHYTEAGLKGEALCYWQQAGTRAAERSANTEAISHFTTAMHLLSSLPDSPARAARELNILMSLGPVLIVSKGNASPEVEQTYLRTRELCQRLSDSQQLFPVLFGLRSVYLVRGEIIRAHELSEQLVNLAQTENDSDHLIEAHLALGNTSHLQGILVPSRTQFEQALELYDPKQHRSHISLYGLDPAVFCLCKITWLLWFLGFPDQALERARELVRFAREVSHPHSLVLALLHASTIHELRHEWQLDQLLAEEAARLCVEHGVASLLGHANGFLGIAMAEQGHIEEGIARIQQALAAKRAASAVLYQPSDLRKLAQACYRAGRTADGLKAVTEGQALLNKTAERLFEAELWRLKGELLLQAKPADDHEDTEHCFLKAIGIARQQQAKSWELRATTSLARLWQQQRKIDDARSVLSDIFGWFTEGFETGDLREARELLEAFS